MRNIIPSWYLYNIRPHEFSRWSFVQWVGNISACAVFFLCSGVWQCTLYWLNFMLGKRYQRRRSRSRSASRSPGVHDGHNGDRRRNRIRSPSPREKRPALSDKLKSRLGPPVEKSGRATSRSRSKSRGPRSVSPDAVIEECPTKVVALSPSRSRSSSPAPQRGLVSYEDISPSPWICAIPISTDGFLQWFGSVQAFNLLQNQTVLLAWCLQEKLFRLFKWRFCNLIIWTSLWKMLVWLKRCCFIFESRHSEFNSHSCW